LIPAGETLYNGIILPETWPPVVQNGADLPPLPPPYLKNKPEVIPIDIGRQLFVDDFLIESTTLKRLWHQPVKHAGNPVLTPERPWEQGGGVNPMAAPFSDGCFYDATTKRFMLWYSAGWYGNTALAVSDDGSTWRRPEFDVFPGSNLVTMRDKPLWRRDNVSVWLDHDTTNANQRFKMTCYARTGEVGAKLDHHKPGLLFLSSPDGSHWNLHGSALRSGDNTTMFYNPFRKVWVVSHRIFVGNERARAYWESPNLFAGVGDGFEKQKPTFWSRADNADKPHPQIGIPPQIYKIDAAPYESIMLGLFEILYGPSNEACAAQGIPKNTEIQLGYSRDGFHWDRPNRRSFIAGTRDPGNWERGYISSCGGGCVIVGDELWFYYGAFRGDEMNHSTDFLCIWGGLYANASTGIAKLRRDGFASMHAEVETGVLTTSIVRFTGRHLFVNVNVPRGELRAEVLDADGRVIAPFAKENCKPISADKAKQAIQWQGVADLSTLHGKGVRFRFHLRQGDLYAFWVSPDTDGTSGGYVAAGGPGFTGARDVGKAKTGERRGCGMTISPE